MGACAEVGVALGKVGNVKLDQAAQGECLNGFVSISFSFAKSGTIYFLVMSTFGKKIWEDKLFLMMFTMDNTMLIQITNHKAIGLLHELEELQLIKVLKENIYPVRPRLSEKYKGIISKEQGKNLQDHIKKMRSEWNSI